MDSMTPAQQEFLMKTLPEFVLGEQGRGFAMEIWKEEFDPGTHRNFDDVVREVPACGTIMCLGGSAETLLKFPRGCDSQDVGAAMGLSFDESNGLFYGWGNTSYGDCCWPLNFRKDFENATTAIAKATVAVRLCVLVGQTKGACLHGDSV